jgi:hypothetical protein
MLLTVCLLTLPTACSGGSAASSRPKAAATASTPPTPPTPGPCPPSSAAAATGSLSGLGASFGAWSAAHANDPSLTAVCTPSGQVVRVDQNLQPPAPADENVQAVPGSPVERSDTAIAAARRLLPPDVVLADDVTKTDCRIVSYRSAALAQALGDNGVGGKVDVVLESAAGAPFHQQQIARIRLQVSSADTIPSC